MTPEHWQQVKQILESALELAPDRRAVFLNAACAGKANLRTEVESLIARHEQPGSFMDTPAGDLKAELLAEQPANPFVGQVLGRYRILGPLGAGGMGEVYRALDTQLDREVAIKVLPATYVADAERLRRFRQEARATSALNHPNIVTIHEVGQASTATGALHYIVTELIDGVTLREQMGGKPLALQAALDVAVQIASALQAAHTAGIVHRDIKPENVMLRRDGFVKVLDFGLAKLTEQRPPAVDSARPTIAQLNTAPGMVMGTVAYMSPEQARGLTVDARTDIWSLGVVLYEMTAGRPPFAGASMGEVFAAILEKEPPPLARHAPPELQSIVSQALTKSRARRYQTAQDLLDDLKKLKRKLEREAEWQGVVSPEVNQAARTDDGRAHAATLIEPAAQPTSSAEYLVGVLKRHKRGSAAALAALALTVAAIVYFSAAGGGKPAIKSVAVLPFVNGSTDPEAEYLADGITEGLINSLSQISQLRVIARTTAFTYKRRAIELSALARDLKVDAVLTGRVAQRGDAWIIQADLVDVADGAQLWGERYQRRLAEVMTLPDSIAREISEKLRLRLTSAEQQQLTKRYTDNTAAYQLYLKGRFHAKNQTREGCEKGLEYFQQAIAADPHFALAYSGLADTYVLMGNLDYLPPREIKFKAEEAARKALELDPNLAEAYASSGYLKMWYDHNWPAAERELKRALELNSNYSLAHYKYGIYLAMMGRLDGAQVEFQRALELDPLAPGQQWGMGRVLYWSHQYDQAITAFQQTLELDKHYWLAHSFIGHAATYKGALHQALTAAQQAVSMSDRHPAAIAPLGLTHAAAGRNDEARKLLAELLARSKQAYVSPYYIALLYTGLGEHGQAFAWLEKLYEERYGLLLYVKVDPNWDSLRADARYADLMRRLGLSP